MSNLYVRCPSDEILSHRKAWSKQSSSSFSAGQAHVLIVGRQEKGFKRGPAIKNFEVPAGADYELQNKHVIVVKKSGEIQESLLKSVSSKLGAELTTKVSISLAAGKSLPELNLTNEISGKLLSEMAEEIKWTISSKRAFEIEQRTELTKTIKFSASTETKRKEPLRLAFYPLLWTKHLDFYLYRYSFLQLEHKSTWYWSDVRKTMKSEVISHVVPLFRLSFFEPQDELSIAEDECHPEVDHADVHSLVLSELSLPCPVSTFPRGGSLQDLAKIAFPTTSEKVNRMLKSRPWFASKRPAAKAPAKKAAAARKAKVKSPKTAKTNAKKQRANISGRVRTKPMGKASYRPKAGGSRAR